MNKHQLENDLGLTAEPEFEKGDVLEYTGGDWNIDALSSPDWDGQFEVEEIRYVPASDEVEYTSGNICCWIPEAFLRKVG